MIWMVIFATFVAVLNLFGPIQAQEEASSDLGNILPQVQYNNCGFKIPGVAEPSFPFIAAIGYNNSRGNVFFGCGGALINRKYVLTAASCHTSERPITEVLLGEQCFESLGLNCSLIPQPLRYTIDPMDITIHDGYVPSDVLTHGNNLALIRLPVLATTYTVNSEYPVMPICLAFRSDIVLPTAKYVATGWEVSVTIPGNFSKVQEQEIHLIANETCKKIPNYVNLDITRSICASGGSDPSGNPTYYPCVGLPGSPLMSTDGTHLFLAGILSVQNRCGGKRDIPDVYINIQSYINWIRDNIKR